MDNAVFYTFSTIAQTLAGAVALVGAFALYRLQLLNSAMDISAALVRDKVVDSRIRQDMTLKLIEGDPEEALRIASKARETLGQGAPVGLGQVEIDAHLDKVIGLRGQKLKIKGLLHRSLLYTAPLIGLSIAALALNPWLGQARSFFLVAGVVWCWVCLGFYARLVKSATS